MCPMSLQTYPPHHPDRSLQLAPRLGGGAGVPSKHTSEGQQDIPRCHPAEVACAWLPIWHHPQCCKGKWASSCVPAPNHGHGCLAHHAGTVRPPGPPWEPAVSDPWGPRRSGSRSGSGGICATYFLPLGVRTMTTQARNFLPINCLEKHWASGILCIMGPMNRAHNIFFSCLDC